LRFFSGHVVVGRVIGPVFDVGRHGFSVCETRVLDNIIPMHLPSRPNLCRARKPTIEWDVCVYVCMCAYCLYCSVIIIKYYDDLGVSRSDAIWTRHNHETLSVVPYKYYVQVTRRIVTHETDSGEQNKKLYRSLKN